MHVINVPYRLRLATSLLFFVFPFLASEVAIASGAPWWRLPIAEMILYSSLGLAVASTAIYMIHRSYRFIMIPLRVLFIFWIVLSIYLSLKMKSTSLGFFSVVLISYSIIVLSWIKRELSRTFFDSQLMWYQGLPKGLPHIQCEVNFKSKHIPFKVCRLDHEGVFIFTDEVVTELIKVPKNIDLGFQFRDVKVSTQGQIMVALRQYNGFGVVFKPKTPDDEKKLGDFVHIVQGEGYEAATSN